MRRHEACQRGHSKGEIADSYGGWGAGRNKWEHGFLQVWHEQSGISLNLRTGPTGHATLFNQWEGALVFINKQFKTSPQWSKIFKTAVGVLVLRTMPEQAVEPRRSTRRRAEQSWLKDCVIWKIEPSWLITCKIMLRKRLVDFDQGIFY